MTEHSKYNDWIDRYVKDELSDEEVVLFEEQLINDSQLQSQLEAVLVIKEALKSDHESGTEFTESEFISAKRNQWSSMAIAASVVLAVVSTTLYWRTSVEVGHLQQQLTSLKSPRSTVLSVPVNIMRSGGATTAGTIIQKPGDNGVIVLDIELSAGFHKLETINFQLQTDTQTPALEWSAAPNSSGRTTVVLNADVVPDGMVRLTIADPSGDLLESRLLEIR